MLDGWKLFVHHFLILVTGMRQRSGHTLVLLRRVLLRGRFGLIGSGSGLCGPLLAQGPSSSGLFAKDLRATLMV
jgi:hypothetical protein